MTAQMSSHLGQTFWKEEHATFRAPGGQGLRGKKAAEHHAGNAGSTRPKEAALIS